MFSPLTGRQLAKLWNMLESAMYHFKDYHGDTERDTWMELHYTMWDVATEMDKRD
jgi:hypothetical protein